MKYSIIISPIKQNSNAILHAQHFIQALLKQPQHNIQVFFYGYAVASAFSWQPSWHAIAQQNVSLMACSTIAQQYLDEDKNLVEYVQLAGLGQWMESVHNADKNIEFV